MAISIRQVLAEGVSSSQRGSVQGKHYQEAFAWTTDFQSWKPVEQAILQSIQKLRAWVSMVADGFRTPLLPVVFQQAVGLEVRRIVEIGCGQGAFTNVLALRFPRAEIVGIDPDPLKIALAQKLVGHCPNVRFIQGDALTLDEIPCDRIVYNHCLSNAENFLRFKKLVLKTSAWLVDEGDFWVKESLWAVARRPAFLRALCTYWETASPLAEMVGQALSSLGHSLAEVGVGRGPLGLPSELYLRSFPLGMVTLKDLLSALPASDTRQEESLPFDPVKPHPVEVVQAETPLSLRSIGSQSNDELLGYLFSSTGSNRKKVRV